MFGNHGKILKVDLSAGSTEVETFDDAFSRKYLGGNGLAAKLVYDLVPADADPFGPENAVVFTTGPMTDTPAWGASRGHLAMIAPMTNYFADSNYGGKFAVAHKRTGFDAIVITGKSDSPKYLLVTEEGGTLHDASELWGKTTEDTIEILEDREGPECTAAAIGPAAAPPPRR